MQELTMLQRQHFNFLKYWDLTKRRFPLEDEKRWGHPPKQAPTACTSCSHAVIWGCFQSSKHVNHEKNTSTFKAGLRFTGGLASVKGCCHLLMLVRTPRLQLKVVMSCCVGIIFRHGKFWHNKTKAHSLEREINPLKMECGVIENGRTHNPLTQWTVPVPGVVLVWVHILGDPHSAKLRNATTGGLLIRGNPNSCQVEFLLSPVVWWATCKL